MPALDQRGKSGTADADLADAERSPTPSRRRRHLVVTSLAAAVAVLVVASALLVPSDPASEVVTATIPRGNGAGTTSTHAAEPTAVLWSRERVPSEPHRLNGSLEYLGGHAGLLVFVAGRDLTGLDAATGAVRWRLPAGWERVFVTDRRIVAQVGVATVLVTDVVDPETTSRLELDDVTRNDQPPVVLGAAADVIVTYDRAGRRLVGIDADDGARRWQRADVDDFVLDVANDRTGAAVRALGVIAPDGLHVVEPVDGDALTTLAWGPHRTLVASKDGLVMTRDPGDGLHVADLRYRRSVALALEDEAEVPQRIMRAREHHVVVFWGDATGPQASPTAFDLRTGEPLGDAGQLPHVLAAADGVSVEFDGHELVGIDPEGRERWRYSMDRSDLVVDLYVTSAGRGSVVYETRLPSGRRAERLHVLDLHDGTVRWEAEADSLSRGGSPLPFGPAAARTSQALVDDGGFVYVPWQGSVTRVDPVDGTDVVAMTGELAGLLPEGVVSLYRGDIVLRAPDDETLWIAESDGTRGWQRAWIVGSHVAGLVSDTPSGDRKAVLLDGSTGQPIDEAAIDGPMVFPDPSGYVVWGSELTRVAVRGGELVTDWTVPGPDVGFESGSVVATGDQMLVATTSTLLLLNNEDGSVVSRRLLDRPIDLPVAVHDGIVVATSADRVLGLDLRTGELRWATPLEDLATSAPTIAGEAVYVGTATGDVAWFDLRDGEPRGRIHTGFEQVIGSLTVAHGIVYAITDAGAHMVALGRRTPDGG